MANSMPELAYALLRKNGFSRATSLGFIVDMYLVVNDA